MLAVGNKVSYCVKIGRYDNMGEWKVTQVYGSAGSRSNAENIARELNRKHGDDAAFVSVVK